jgi:hypothetical protein
MDQYGAPQLGGFQATHVPQCLSSDETGRFGARAFRSCETIGADNNKFVL